MNQTLDLPICGLEETFPDNVFLLAHPSTGRYGCYCHDGVHGLAAFSTEAGAFRFAEFIDLSGMATVELPFDEAREVAKERPLPVVSLMLLDRMDDPKIHYVR
jgi:hypothetical protein